MLHLMHGMSRTILGGSHLTKLNGFRDHLCFACLEALHSIPIAKLIGAQRRCQGLDGDH